MSLISWFKVIFVLFVSVPVRSKGIFMNVPGRSTPFVRRSSLSKYRSRSKITCSWLLTSLENIRSRSWWSYLSMFWFVQGIFVNGSGLKPGVHGLIYAVHGCSSSTGHRFRSCTLCSWPFKVIMHVCSTYVPRPSKVVQTILVIVPVH